MTMIQKYMDKQEKFTASYGKKAIVLEQCGSFFEVYGFKDKSGNFISNTLPDFNRICECTIAKKSGKHKGRNIWMAGFSPLEKLDKYVGRLIDAGYHVEVWVQSKHPGAGNAAIRTKLGIFSPGTNFNLTPDKLSNNTMVVWVDQYDKTLVNKEPTICCGVANIDVLTGNSVFYEFREKYSDSPTTFDQLERFYSTYNPTEVIIIHSGMMSDIESIIRYAGITAKGIHKFPMGMTDLPATHSEEINNCEKQLYQKHTLSKFYTISDYNSFIQSLGFYGRPMALQAFTFLLHFIYQHNPELVDQIDQPTLAGQTGGMALLNHPLRQLNIIPTGQGIGQKGSLVTLLNRCKTPMGRREFERQLLNPSIDPDYLNPEYEAIQYVKEHWELFERIHKKLNEMKDFERLRRKIFLRKLTPVELTEIYLNTKTILEIEKELREEPFIKGYLGRPSIRKDTTAIRNALANAINFKVARGISSVNFETNIFNRDIYPDLDTAIGQWREGYDHLEAIRAYLDGVLRKYENRQKTKEYVSIHRTNKSGLFLITTTRRAELLKQLLPNTSVTLMYKSSFDKSAREMRFSPESLLFKTYSVKNKRRLDSPELTDVYIAVGDTTSEVKEQLEIAYANFIFSLRDFIGAWKTIEAYLGNLDVIITKAKLAIDFKYCRPLIKKADRAFIHATGMRHPLIERIETDELYVPNDIDLGREKCGYIVYGTNGVGKSSVTRAVGMSVMMAQAGMFVPCESFTFSPYTKIFTRILGNDNIFKGQSSFAVEMSELRLILRTADENSLILGDELCSGTESESAVAIFSAGLIQLHDIKASHLFASHLHTLCSMDRIKALANEGLRITHMSVNYDRARDLLIYERKLIDGPGDKLYGLEVCKAMDLPGDFLKLANTIRCERATRCTSLLGLPRSRYSAKVLKGDCAKCGEAGIDIHHCQPQANADENGFIGHFHKNHPANQIPLCKKCHDELTRSGEQLRRTKTDSGYILESC